MRACLPGSAVFLAAIRRRSGKHSAKPAAGAVMVGLPIGIDMQPAAASEATITAEVMARYFMIAAPGPAAKAVHKQLVNTASLLGR